VIEIVALASGSNGNAAYVETGSARLLIDCGISALQLEKRLRLFGRDARSIDAILVTHDHLDHVAGIRALARRHRLRVLLNEPTLVNARTCLRGVHTVEVFPTGEHREVGATVIRSVPVSHDAAESVGYVIESEGVAAGIFTDLGVATQEVEREVSRVDALVLETNHDLDRLMTGRYPEELRSRVASDLGHLSNRQAADLVRAHAAPRLRHLLCAHLSAENNTPSLVTDELERALGTRQDLETHVHLTSRHAPSPWIRVEASPVGASR
jgi:phosphoribosyl 1,2-cyclic phosphodiesterase